MTAPVTLPITLNPWARQLGALTDDVAVALGPWVTSMTALLTPDEPAAGDEGEPDGFDGLTTHGEPDHLLLSEWLLAATEPDEFLRRAADGELLHMAPAFRRPEPHGRLLVLVDAGPAQWGAPRLVQLAIILALHHRAESCGLALSLGVLTAKPGRWHDAELQTLLATWQRSRTTATAGAHDLEAWRAAAAPEDDIWLLTGEPHEVAGVRTVAIAESGWNADGVDEVTVVCGHRRTVLSMPPPAASLKALRGAGFRSFGPTASGGVMRFARFPNGSATMIGRGRDDRTLVSVHLPDGRPRRHQLSSPLIAAGLHGRRTIALVEGRSTLSIVTIGRPLTSFASSTWLLADLPDLTDEADGTLAPCHVAGEYLLARLGGHWWSLPQAGAPVLLELDAAGYGDMPRVAPSPDLAGVPAGAHVVFGGPKTHAWSTDGHTWTTSTGAELATTDHVIGMTVAKSDHVLVTQSPGGQILRLVGPDGVRTLTRWSGETGTPAVHTTRPWIAITQLDETVVVVDIDADKVVYRLRATA